MSSAKLILAATLVGLVSGCMAQHPVAGVKPTRNESLRTMDPARIQADTMGFADRFVTAMGSIYDDVEKRASNPAARDASHQLKTELAVGAIGSAVNPRPIAGLMDMVVLVRLLRQAAEDPWTTRTFESDAPRLVDTLKQKETDLRLVASQYLTDSQLAEIDLLADQWYSKHPDIHSLSRVHLADLPEPNTPLRPGQRPPGSIMSLLFGDPAAQFDPALREIELSRATSERMFFYLQRLPLLLSLQTESFYRQLLEAPQFARVMDNMSVVAGSTTRFADASSRFNEIIARFPQQLSDERQQAVVQISAQLSKQLDVSIRQLSDAVTVQREAAIAQATARIAGQQDLAVQQMTAALHQQQEAFVSNLEAATDRSITHFFKGLAALAASLIIVALLCALFGPRLRRGWSGHPEQPTPSKTQDFRGLVR